jgi:phosphoribosylamine---glycine ligase
MRVLVVGGGGREHALVWKLASERHVSEIVCAPGNAGIATLAHCVPADVGSPAALLAIAAREAIDLTIVGPELPLSRGVVDAFIAERRLIFGPTQAAARLESSKAFAKAFMTRHRVPTARYRVCAQAADALGLIARGEFGTPVVIKADGLAAGKGVVIAESRADAEAAIRTAMVDRRFGDAGSQLVIEEHLAGREMSFFVLTDGTRAIPLPSAEDHKRAFDGDRGPNTGGMGAFAPSPQCGPAVADRIMREIVRPVLAGMREEGHDFRGFLYAGLMMTPDGPCVIEFNVRFGDPEAQVVLPMIEDDLLPLLAEAAAGDLRTETCRVSAEPHVGVVIASRGYPETSDSGRAIDGLDAAARVPGVTVFHAGTAAREGRTVTSGGRVLTVVGRGADYREAAARAYDGVSRVSFDGMHYRRDIAARAVSVDASPSPEARS